MAYGRGMVLPDQLTRRVDALIDGLIEGGTRQARAVGAGVIAVAVAGLGWVGLLGAAWQPRDEPARPPGTDPVGTLEGSWPLGAGAWPGAATWGEASDAVSLGEPTVPLRESAPRIFAALSEQPPVLSTLVDVARAHEMDPHLVVALAWHESRWDPSARSSKGAVGVLQVKPSTVARVSEAIGKPLQPRDPTDNATAGVIYLTWLQERFATTRRALIAYNQGVGALRRDGPYPGAAWFAEAVLATRAAFAEAGWAP